MDFKKLIMAFALISMIFLSGCINIDVEQKLKRNGHYDMALKISTSQEYKMILNGLKEGFQVEDSVKDKFEYSETDTSITYSFKDIDPSKDKVLFKEPEKKDSDTDGVFGQSQEGPDSGFIDPKNVDFKKEFRFPYYEFIYNLKMAPESDEEHNDLETLSANDYIFDEASLLDQQSKNQIIQNINDVYKSDSIEIIVVTKDQMSAIDFFSYKFDFTSNFKFKNKNKNYVMIFASTNDNGLCKVESNIFSDTGFSSKIKSLNTDFSNNCKTDYSGQVRNVVSELNTFFKNNDLKSSNQMAEQMGNLFKIGYTVEVFGKITETNGLKMGDNKVKFDINPTEEGEYTIVFKDFFLATILGDSYWIYLSVIGLVIIGGIGFLVFSKSKASQPSKPIVAPLAVNPQVLDYVIKARSTGMTDAQIKSSLVQSGWSEKDADIALTK